MAKKTGPKPGSRRAPSHNKKGNYFSAAWTAPIADDYLARGYDARKAGKPRDLYRPGRRLTSHQKTVLAEYQEGWDAADKEVRDASLFRARADLRTNALDLSGFRWGEGNNHRAV